MAAATSTGLTNNVAAALSYLFGAITGIIFLVIEQHFAGRKKELVCAGPPSLEQRMRAAEQALYPDFFGPVQLGFPLRTRVLGPEPMELGGARVSALPVRHVRLAEPHGLRVRVDGRLIAYSGDASWSDDLVALAKGADLFICEATLFAAAEEKDNPVHVSYETLRRNRARFECRRIVLTHLGATSLAHLSEMDMEFASDGQELTL